MATASTFRYSPLPLPSSANPKYLGDYGRRVEGVDFDNLTQAQTDELVDQLYRHSILLFKNTKISPKQQFELTNVCFLHLLPDLVAQMLISAQAFDPKSASYGHKTRTTEKDKLSVLHPDLKTIPNQPQVQLIGNGKVPGNHEGLESVSQMAEIPRHRKRNR